MKNKIVLLASIMFLLPALGAASDYIIRDSGGNELFAVNQTGEKNIYNGPLNMNGNPINTPSQLETGGQNIQIRDTTNGQDIARFQEGGNVEVPNGMLAVGGTNPSHQLDVDGSVSFGAETNYAPSGFDLFGNGQHLITIDETDGKVSIPSGSLDMSGNSITNIGSASLGWSNLTNYPSGCASDEAVQVIGDTVTCTPLNPGGTVETGGGARGQVAYFLDSENVTGTDNFYWNNSEVRLGLGTSTPSSTLDVNGQTNMRGQLDMNQNAANNFGSIEMDGDISGGGIDIALTEVSSIVSGANTNAGQLTLETQSGGGSGQITLRDGNAPQDILRANEGGNVEIPNGNLLMNNNTISDVGAPQDVYDAVNKQYVDTSDDTIADDQNLQDVLGQGNAGGGNSIRDISALNVTGVANFTQTGVDIYKPLSVKSAGPFSVGSGIAMTDSSMNTIESYSTLYLKTSSGSPSDIVLQPSGEAGVDSNLSVTGQLDMDGSQIIDTQDPDDPQDVATKSYVDAGDTGSTQTLAEVLNQGNSADDSNIDMSGNSITSPNLVDGVDLDSPGNAISVSSNQYQVVSGGIDTSEIAADAVTGTEIASGAVGSTQVSSGAITDKELASNAVTASGGELDSTVAGNYLSLNSGTLDVSDNWVDENGDTMGGDLNMGNNNVDDVASIDGGGDAIQVNDNLALNNNGLDSVNQLNFKDDGPDGAIDWANGAEIYSAPLDDSNSAGYLQIVNNQGIAFEPGSDGTTEAVMETDGSLGLGTTSPQSRLDVDGNVRVRGNLNVWGTVTNTDVQNLNVNGSILPPSGYDASFDIGSSSRRWRDAHFSRDVYVGGTTDSVDLDNPGNAISISSNQYAVQEGQISHDNIGGVSYNDHHGTGSGIKWDSNNDIAHVDTSSQADTSNSNGQVIQDLQFDGMGHVTTASSTDLDTRYYTESESDSNFVDASGDTMSGNLDVGGNVISGIDELYSTYSTTTHINFNSNGDLQLKTGDSGSSAVGLEVKNSTQNVRVPNGNLDMNSNSITNYFDSDACPSGEVVADINDDGSYTCTSITGEADDVYVKESGDTMTGALTMNGNDIKKAGVVNASDLQIMGESTDGRYVDEGGDAMSGPLNMQNNDITNVDQVLIKDDGSSPGQNMLEVGDDSYLTDVDSSNTLGVQGQNDASQATIEMGSAGAKVSGTSSGEACIGDQCT